MTVQRLVAVDVPVHAEHAAPAGLVVRAAIVVVFVGATKKVSDVGGGVWFFSTDLLFFTGFACGEASRSMSGKILLPLLVLHV